MFIVAHYIDSLVKDFDFILIGSGPTGTAALEALIGSNRSIAVLDVGSLPSSNLTKWLSELRELPWRQWPSGTRESLMRTTSTGLSPKTYFGESFPYDTNQLGIDYLPGSPRASVSVGGFSTVWGATALPFPRGTWPESLDHIYEGMALSYKVLTEKVGVAGEPGPVDIAYPNSSFTHSLPSTSPLSSLVRSESFFENVSSASFSALSLPRLAVSRRAEPNRPNDGCTNCGLCQIGCPYGHIWISPSGMLKKPHVAQVTKFQGIVDEIKEINSNRPTVVFRSRTSNKVLRLSANHILLAAGPMSTAGILLRSRALDGPVTIKDSQTFFVGGVSTINLGQHDFSSTLTDAISLAPNEDGRQISHMQLYGPSEYLQARIFSSSIAFKVVPNWLRHTVSSYLYVGLGYLDSSDSSGIDLSLSHSGSIQVTEKNIEISRKTRWAASSHESNLRRIGVRLLPSFIQDLRVGGGNHLGASIPMVGTSISTRGLRHWSDELGRPHSRGNLHIVDSSVLPFVPAGPLTLSAMANAFRIARELI
jgi:hypothetical protein